MTVLRSLEGTEACQNYDGGDDDVWNAYCIMFNNQTRLNTELDWAENDLRNGSRWWKPPGQPRGLRVNLIGRNQSWKVKGIKTGC